MERTLPPALLPAGWVDAYAAAVQFRVLGPIEVTENGHSYAVGGPKQRAVLALLIAHAGRPVSTGSLIEGVCGDAPPSGPRRSIQTYVSNLRSEIGDVIQSTSDGYELVAERGQVDALMFEDMVTSASSEPPAEASRRLREVLSRWRGHPYADTDTGDVVDSEIRRLDLRVVRPRLAVWLTSRNPRNSS